MAALVAGDRLIGSEGALRLCPQSWLAGARLDRAATAALMRPLLELAIESVLVSHGEPALRGGRRSRAPSRRRPASSALSLRAARRKVEV